MAIEVFNGVGMIPVAGDDHVTTIHLYGISRSSFYCQTAKAVEGMGGRVVHLNLVGLTDAKVFFETTRQQHLAIFQG